MGEEIGCKDRLKGYLDLIRFTKPTGTLLLFYPIFFSFLWLDPFFAEWRLLILFAYGAFIMRSIGCIINDLWDYKFDRKVERTKERPLASGVISKLGACMMLAFFLLSSLVLLLSLNHEAIFFCLFLIIPISIYPLTKRFFKFPQLFLGLTFNLGIFVAWLAIGNEISLVAYLTYIACVFWTIGYDTIYAHQDKDDDLALDLNSTAISFGKHNLKALIFCYAAFILIFLGIGIMKGLGIIFFILIQILGIYIVKHIHHLDLDDKQSCDSFFKQNSRVGLILSTIIILSNYIYLS